MDPSTPVDPPEQPQRKLITVLFADIKGSTEMVATLDPEDAMELIHPVLAIMRDAVNRFDGIVSKQAGDGVMAFFGAPVALDDHAERACRAASRIHEDVAKLGNPAMSVRVGVHSGEVVLHQVRHDFSSVYDAAGPVVHIAQRAESLAPPGGTVVTADCHALLNGRFDASPFQATLKGVDHEVRLFRLNGLKALGRWEARAAGGLSAFVGREDEREIIAAAAREVRAGRPRIITIEGEPGCGKSRLIHGALAGGAFEDWAIWRCEAEATQRNVAWGVARKLLFVALGAREEEEIEVARRRLDGSLGPADALEALARATLLGAPIVGADWGEAQPEHRRNLIQAVLMKALRRLAVDAARPAAIVIEDLQWIDPESLGALASLAESADGATFLLLSTRRPAEERIALPASEARVTLAPLRASEAALLIDELLGEAAPERLKQRLIDHTGGNPLFIEEIARHLKASGLLSGAPDELRSGDPLRDVGLPTTIQSVIAARIDGLSDKARALLQAASIFGSGASPEEVARLSDAPPEVSDDAFAELARGRFLGVVANGDAEEVVFAHDLIQEVAYAGILRARRRELHRRVLGGLAAPDGVPSARAAAALYRHAAGAEDWSAAVVNARRAAAAAIEQSAYGTSIEYIDLALAALGRLPESDENARLAIDMRLEARLAFGATAQLTRMLTFVKEAEQRAEAIHDGKRSLAAAIQKATALVYVGAPDDALTAARDAVARAAGEGAPHLESVARYVLGQVNFVAGNFRQAAEMGAVAEALLPPGAGMARLGTTGTTLTLIKVLRATSLASLGDFEPAAACLDEAAALADQTRRPYDIASLAYGAGYSALLRGRVADAIARVEPAMDVAKSLDIVFFQPVLGNLLGQAYLAAGRVSDALAVLREAMRVVRGLGHVGGGGRLSIGLSLGGALLRSGEMDEAQGLIGACLDNARQQGYRGIHCNAARQMAAVRAARGADPNAIETLLSEAIDVATEIEARPSRAMAELALAEHLAKTGDRVGATALFGSVAAEFDAMGVIPMAARARQALAALG